MKFEWTINVGNLLTVLAFLVAGMGLVFRHLRALDMITETLRAMEATMIELQKEIRAIEHRLTRTETLLETVLPPRGSL